VGSSFPQDSFITFPGPFPMGITRPPSAPQIIQDLPLLSFLPAQKEQGARDVIFSRVFSSPIVFNELPVSPHPFEPLPSFSSPPLCSPVPELENLTSPASPSFSYDPLRAPPLLIINGRLNPFFFFPTKRPVRPTGLRPDDGFQSSLLSSVFPLRCGLAVFSFAASPTSFSCTSIIRCLTTRPE